MRIVKYQVETKDHNLLGSCTDKEQAISAALGYAKSRNEMVYAVAITDSGSKRRVECYPDGRKVRLWLREKITLTHGKAYRLHGDTAGGEYICTSCGYAGENAVLTRKSDGWTFVAHGVGQYEDGSVDWDYSTGGQFLFSRKENP